jgi:hypothetical protein
LINNRNPHQPTNSRENNQNDKYSQCLFHVFIILIIINCSKESEGNDDQSVNIEAKTLPTVLTKNVTNIGFTSAEVFGELTSNGGGVISKHGFVLSKNPLPTISDKMYSMDGDFSPGEFRWNMEDLTSDTNYYVRSFATNSKGTGYGNEITFKTGIHCSEMILKYPGYEVWAGDTPYFQGSNHPNIFYNINKFDYKLIGFATTSQTFNTGNYKYYVIVSKFGLCIDAIQFNNDSYLNNGQGYTIYSGLVDLDKMRGAPDGISGNFGLFCVETGNTNNGYITDDASILSRGGGLKVIVGANCGRGQ